LPIESGVQTSGRNYDDVSGFGVLVALRVVAALFEASPDAVWRRLRAARNRGCQVPAYVTEERLPLRPVAASVLVGAVLAGGVAAVAVFWRHPRVWTTILLRIGAGGCNGRCRVDERKIVSRRVAQAVSSLAIPILELLALGEALDGFANG
jgi:hypothetical protein